MSSTPTRIFFYNAILWSFTGLCNSALALSPSFTHHVSPLVGMYYVLVAGLSWGMVTGMIALIAQRMCKRCR
jgi:hypothetical protein